MLAQDITDAVRYSIDDIQGTARFKALSGAFGALGGDMSAVNINPAGSAIFNNSHVSFSLGSFNNSNDVNYFGETNRNSNSNINFNQLGAIFVFENYNQNSPWKKFTLGVAYDRTNVFNDRWLASGINPNTSIGSYFVDNANGLPLDDISALPGETISQAYSEIGSVFGFRNQQAFLGFESFVIDPNNDENNTYSSNIAGGNYAQQYAYTTRGQNSKLGFNIATSYKDKFYFGLNLNSHSINFEENTFLRENNANEASSIRRVDFDNNLLTTGSGFSFQLGGIAKLSNELRLGISYNSPTWYRISEETSQGISTVLLDGEDRINTTLNPNVTNIYEEYRLQTPGKFTGSLAYVFGKQGLISFDYALKDYSNIRFRPTSDVFFSELNTDITEALTSAASYRLGGEYRYNRLYFRGGYRFEESPYKDDSIFGNLTGYSLGLGYTFGNLNLDLAFSQTQRDRNPQLYDIGLTDSALVQTKFTDIVLSLGFKI